MANDGLSAWHQYRHSRSEEEAFQRTQELLSGKKLIGIWSDWVWPA